MNGLTKHASNEKKGKSEKDIKQASYKEKY